MSETGYWQLEKLLIVSDVGKTFQKVVLVQMPVLQNEQMQEEQIITALTEGWRHVAQMLITATSPITAILSKITWCAEYVYRTSSPFKAVSLLTRSGDRRPMNVSIFSSVTQFMYSPKRPDRLYIPTIPLFISFPWDLKQIIYMLCCGS